MIQKIQPFGDAAILLTFGSQISVANNCKIVDFVKSLKKANIEGILEVIPAYASVTIQYDFSKISYQDLKVQLDVLVVEEQKGRHSKIVKIPVCYHSSLSRDMLDVMSYTGKTKKEIIELHTSKEYLVYMLGFLPGFFYLGGMHAELFCPRKKNPSLKIAAGSVGIAGEQTGVYSVESPGGWQIIGKTPLSIFDKKRKEAVFLVNQGDVVQFYEISLDEYKQYKK